MIRKGNVTIGLQTRFGPGWTGIRCGARTKLGGECQRPAVKKTGRCTRHGGKSTVSSLASLRVCGAFLRIYGCIIVNMRIVPFWSIVDYAMLLSTKCVNGLI